MDASDRFALLDLVQRYARFADHADGPGLAGLFREGAVLAIHDDGSPAEHPTRVLTGREEIAASVSGLARFDATAHVMGQHSAELDGDLGRGEALCVAHHLYRVGEAQFDRVLFCHYHDSYERDGSGWQFAHRRIMVKWEDHRPITRGAAAPSV
jgi:hypothetical protein